MTWKVLSTETIVSQSELFRNVYVQPWLIELAEHRHRFSVPPWTRSVPGLPGRMMLDVKSTRWMARGVPPEIEYYAATNYDGQTLDCDDDGHLIICWAECPIPLPAELEALAVIQQPPV